MIISIHIRKAAGTSFRKALQEYYKNNLLLDYGDEIGSSHISSQEKRIKSQAYAFKNEDEIISKYKIIHGHFFGHKYSTYETSLEYATFLRDPVQRVLSNFYYLQRNPDRKNPDGAMIHQQGFTLEDYIEHKDARNLQSQFLGNKKLSEFKFIGLSEQYKRSVCLFNHIFNTSLKYNHVENTNPNRSTMYKVETKLVDHIKKHNELDIELYKEGSLIFKKMQKAYDL